MLWWILCVIQFFNIHITVYKSHWTQCVSFFTKHAAKTVFSDTAYFKCTANMDNNGAYKCMVFVPYRYFVILIVL